MNIPVVMSSTSVYQWVSLSEKHKPDRVIITYTNNTFLENVNLSTPVGDNSSLQDSTTTSTSSPWWVSDYPSGYSWPRIIVASVLITVIILMILVGNFLVMWAIVHDRTLKTTQNLFIASLAFADFCIGLLIIPLSLTNELLGYWLFGMVFCEIYKAVDVLLCTASIMSLCLISLDRYWSITRAVHYARQRTRKRAAVMIFTVWFISAVVSIPPLIGWKQPARESEWTLCELSEDIGYVVYSSFGSFFIPAFIMVFVLVKIYQAATQRARRNITAKAPMGTSREKSELKNSQESSVTEHPGRREETADVIETNCSGPQCGNVTENMTEETACDTVYETTAATTSEDEVNLEMRQRIRGDSSKLHYHEECSNLLTTDSDSNRHQEATYSEKVNRVKMAFESIPASDKDSTEQLDSIVETPTSNAGTPSRGANGERGNGSLQRFKIVELRANGTTAVAATEKKTSKSSILHTLRKHFLSGRKAKGKRRQSENGKPTDFQTAERHKKKLAKARERRATVVLGLVMAAFILCWLPFFSCYLASAFCPGCIPSMVFSVFFWIGYCNSVLNPIIYTVFNRDFRRAFHKILFKRRNMRH